MTREEQIKAIYEKIADKTLSFGCEVNYNNPEGVKHFYVGEGDFGGMLLWKETTIEGYRSCSIETEEGEDIEIIGHPVLIGDLLHYIYTQRIEILGRPFEFKKILDLWEYKIKPIEEQSDKCIDYIYNLIK